MIRSVDEIVVALGNTGAVAAALGKSASTVSSWRARGSIPHLYWRGIVGMAETRGVAGITLESLASLHAERLAPAEAR